MSSTIPMDGATTISQLGGRRIFAMAFDMKRSRIGDAAVILRIASGLKSRDKATHVRITLDVSDTYNVDTCKVDATGIRTINSSTMVYAEDLRRIVETMTGLYLSL